MRRTGRKPNKRPVTLAGRAVERVLLPDVYEPTKFAEVSRAVNTSALQTIATYGRLVGRGDNLEDGRARLDAGNRLAGIWERAGGTGAQAMDYSRIFVDTSFRYDGLSVSADRAFAHMRAIRAFCGDERFAPIFNICCLDMAFTEYAAKQYPGGFLNKRRCDEQYQYLRDSLDRLIEYFGQAVGPDRSRIRAERIIL